MFSKWVDKRQGDGFSSVGAQTGTIKLAMASTQDFLHSWVANSIWLGRAESLIALMAAYLEC